MKLPANVFCYRWKNLFCLVALISFLSTFSWIFVFQLEMAETNSDSKITFNDYRFSLNKIFDQNIIKAEAPKKLILGSDFLFCWFTSFVWASCRSVTVCENFFQQITINHNKHKETKNTFDWTLKQTLLSTFKVFSRDSFEF